MQEFFDCMILVRLPPAILQDWDPLDPLKETIQGILHKPNATAQPPATLSTYLPTNVSQSQGQNYEPFVEQAGNQANFPSATTGPFALGGVVSRYVAIGGAGRAATQAISRCPARFSCQAAARLRLWATHGVDRQQSQSDQFISLCLGPHHDRHAPKCSCKGGLPKACSTGAVP